jgi:hypothetical protein
MQVGNSLQTKVNTASQKPSAPQVQLVKGQDDTVDVYNGSRKFGNGVSGVVMGAAKEAVTGTLLSLPLAGSIVKNLWKAETLGFNISILGTLAALPLAAGSIVVAPFVGAYRGFEAADDANDARRHSGQPLAQDESPAITNSIFKKRESSGASTWTGGLMNSLDKLGDKKLEPGEKKFDIPILSPITWAVGAAVSGAIAGVVGFAAGLVAGSITCGKEMSRAFGKDGKGVGQFVTAPLNMVIAPSLGWDALKEAAPRGASEGWKGHLVKPVIDTARISAKLGAEAIRQAWER